MTILKSKNGLTFLGRSDELSIFGRREIDYTESLQGSQFVIHCEIECGEPLTVAVLHFRLIRRFLKDRLFHSRRPF